MSTCPDPADLAAFVDRKLTGDARAAMEAHLADCDDCREVYAEALRLEPRASVLPFRRRVWAAGGGILALAASLLIVAQVRPDWLRFGPTPYEELVAAVGTNRTVEGRLTGGFEYGPLRSPTRSNERPIVEYNVGAAVANIRELAQRDPSAANLHARGVAELIIGEHAAAISDLEAAVTADPGNAKVHSDLSAAYAARGTGLGDYRSALASADRALSLDGSLQEAHYNRALALERLGELQKAAVEYERILPTAAEGWSDDVRDRLARLRGRR
jgi:tetratricopeptide (TPR) repeat protein